jgi:hypothetical protein
MNLIPPIATPRLITPHQVIHLMKNVHGVENHLVENIIRISEKCQIAIAQLRHHQLVCIVH